MSGGTFSGNLVGCYGMSDLASAVRTGRLRTRTAHLPVGPAGRSPSCGPASVPSPSQGSQARCLHWDARRTRPTFPVIFSIHLRQKWGGSTGFINSRGQSPGMTTRPADLNLSIASGVAAPALSESCSHTSGTLASRQSSTAGIVCGRST